jgi:hypothetical protein
MSTATQRKLLANIGEALYGPRWQSELARNISVSDRTVRRWVAGTDDVSDVAWRDMSYLLENRAIELGELRYRIKDELKIERGLKQ